MTRSQCSLSTMRQFPAISRVRNQASVKAQLGIDARGLRWSAADQPPVEPGSCRLPFPRDRGAGNREHRRDVVFREPTKVPELDDLRLSRAQTREMFEQTILALATAVDARDRYTRNHSGRVSRISGAMARVMRLPEQLAEQMMALRTKYGWSDRLISPFRFGDTHILRLVPR